MEPWVSIITTTHNIVENGQADDFSLLCTLLDMQTYPNIEHIVIDNASTDDTVVLLKDYKNKGYINFYSEHDTGKFNGYNKGILRAKGKYLSFISCDDFYHDITAIYDLVNLMEAENADFAFSPTYCRHPDDFVFLFVPSMHNAFQVMPCPRQAMFFKKSILEKEGYFDEKFKLMADYDLIIRLMLKKYNGIYFDHNFTTYKLGEKIYNNPQQSDIEAKMIYYKNYRSLCNLTDDVIESMVKTSKFPKELLDKLVTRFPEADKELFYERCEQMHKIRLDAYKQRQQQA